MDVGVLIDQVRTKEDFVRFIYKLKEDTHINTDEWENKDISSYLESVASWAEDIDWKFLATLFYVGKIYE